MRASEEIKQEITETQSKLQTLHQSIEKKQRELAKLKESHVQLVESRIGRERLPKSIGKQRESLLSLSLEIENLEGVRGKIEDKLADLKQELARVNLYENQLKQYHEAEKRLLDMATSVVNEIDELNARMDLCRASIEEFLGQPSNPLEILKSILSDPSLSGLSVARFFNGDIAQVEVGENESFIREIVAGYGQLPRKLPILTNVKDSWIALSNYFDFMSRAGGALIPPTFKYVSTEQKSVSPSPNRSQSVPVSPRNLVHIDAHKQREKDLMEWNRNKRLICNR